MPEPMRHDQLPLRPCGWTEPHHPHRRILGPEPAWCAGVAAEWPSERHATAAEAQRWEYDRFATKRGRPGPPAGGRLVHCLHVGHDDDGAGHQLRSDCLASWPAGTSRPAG